MKIVCFGDSVTRGISFMNGRLRIVKANYPSLLQGALKSLGIDVLNKGVFNDNSDLLVHRLEDDVLSEQPDYVLIEIGGNDCNFRWDEVALRPDDEHEPIVPLERYLQNLRTLVERVQKNNSVPVLMNLLPLDPVRYYQQVAATYGKAVAHWIAHCGGIEHWHGMYNRSLCQLIGRLDVLTIDLRTAFKKAADLAVLLSDDGIHPTEAGYKVMSEAIQSSLLPRIGTPFPVG